MYFSPTKLSRPIVLLRAKNWHVNIFFYERAGDLFVFDIWIMQWLNDNH